MTPISFLSTMILITFLKPTTASSHSSWDPAISSLNSENDQVKRRLRSGMPERISHFGGSSMPNSLLHSKDDIENINERNGFENKRMDPSFRSRDYEYQLRDDPPKHTFGGHHNSKNNYHKGAHGNFVREIPYKSHKDRLRRKLDEEKGNMTQNSNITVHNETAVEAQLKPSDEHKNTTKKPCIKTHPYKILSSPTSNATQNSTETNNLKTTDLKNQTTDQKSAKNQSLPNAKTLPTNGTLPTLNETNVNTTTTMTGKEKPSKDGSLPSGDSTLKGPDSGQSTKQKGQGFGLPCRVVGKWISEAGGVTLNIMASQNKSNLDVEVLDPSPAKKGFLSPSWKINGYLPLADSGNNKGNNTDATQAKELGGPIVLTATILKDENGEGKVAVFLGECRACYEGMESLVGMWSVKRLSKDCLDTSLSQREIRDVFHTEVTSTTANEQAKSESSDATKPKDNIDQSRKNRSYRRRSYDKERWRRRYIRDNLRFI